ncbi:hypothetical protein CAP35_04760 [Chitinophagaceae bacterium IBVUCB1]|nr:hypothetical protein CAP35_04760 [Chitinophagaceae bacterium IBVUCB1]
MNTEPVHKSKTFSVLGFLDKYKEFIAILVNVVGGVFFFLSRTNKASKVDFLHYVEVANGVVLLFSLSILIFKKKYLIREQFSPDDLPEKLLEIEESSEDKVTTIKHRIERINNAVLELYHSLKWFTFSLICLYVTLIFFDHKMDDVIEQKKTENAVLVLKTGATRIDSAIYSIVGFTNEESKESAKDTSLAKYNRILLSKSFINLRYDTSYTVLEKKYAEYYLTESFFDNALNVVSGIFLYSSFFILYHRTKNDDEYRKKKWNKITRRNFLPLIFAFSFIMLNIKALIMGFYNMNLITIVSLSRVISGLFNAVGMCLLFSRFLSIEFFLKEIKSMKALKSFYLLGATFFLPLYASVQPLWGLFDSGILGDDDLFKSLILLIALWGKVAFYLFIFYMLDRRIIHKYLYLLIWNEDNNHLSIISKNLEAFDKKQK